MTKKLIPITVALLLATSVITSANVYATTDLKIFVATDKIYELPLGLELNDNE